MMPHERGGVVLRGAYALILRDEPLAGGVVYAALEVSHAVIVTPSLASFKSPGSLIVTLYGKY